MKHLRHDRLSRGAVLFALAMICYMANGRTIAAGDSLPARYLPFSILREGSFRLDGFPFLYRDEGKSYWARRVHGHWVSSYPVGAAIAALPFYAPAVLWRGVRPQDARFEQLEKIAAAAIVALSVAVLDATVTGLTPPAIALGITLAYALGTSSLSVSSQALWQHGPAQLALASGLLLLVQARRGRPALAAWAGLPLAFAVVCRPTNLLLFVPLAAYAVRTYPHAALRFALAAALPLVFQLGYNARYFGDPLWVQFPLFTDYRWRGRASWTVPGLLFSPSRGLFVYSPVLVFGLWGLLTAWRRGGDALLRAIGVGVLAIVALSARWWEWWGGATYGPRLLADLAPLLAFAIHPCAPSLHRSPAARVLFGVTLAWSVLAHGVGAYWDDGSWNAKLAGKDLRAVLASWQDNQLFNALRDGLRLAAASVARSPIPLDPDDERRLWAVVAAEPRHDRALIELRDRYRRAGDDARAEDVEVLRRARFTPAESLGWRFDDQLTLLGIDRAAAGSAEVVITYYWRADRTMSDAYAAYTRLSGPGCGGGSDLVLGAPDHPTTRWRAGEIFKQSQRVAVPASRSPESCSLRLGVWSPGDGRKLYIRHFPRWRRSGVLLVLPTAEADVGGGSTRAALPFTPSASTDMSRRE